MENEKKCNLTCVTFSLNFESIKIKNLENLCYKICPARVKTAQKINQSKRKAHLASLILAAFCIKQQFQISNFSLFKINGKPFLKNQTNAFFNISHTKSAITCATSTCAVGVDVEKIRPISLKLAPKIFCPAELNHFSKLISINKKTHQLIKVWSLKESFAKMKAESIGQNLTSIDHNNIKNTKTFSIKNKFNDEFILCVCTKFKNKFQISEIDFNKLINSFKINSKFF